MSNLFTRKTFQYFDLAKKHNKKKAWFVKHKKDYETYVHEPFEILVKELEHRLSRHVPGIVISSRKISRPLRGKKSAEKNGIVRASIMFYFAEKTTSRFEWNPGLFMQLGDEREDNIIGVGLYGPSSRQMKRLRAAFAEDFETVDRILKDRKLKKFWGAPADQKYVRFPKDYSLEHPAAKYLWYKQFYLTRNFNRKEVASKDFAETVLKSFEAATPFLAWVRGSIGVYDRREWERERAARLDAEEEARI